MRTYLWNVWDCRYFWLSLARLDVRKRYRRTSLGIGWTFLHPVAMALVLGTVFHRLFGVALSEYVPTVLVGLCFWNYFTHIVQHGASCIFWSETYIRQHRAPLAIYPLRIVLSAAYVFGLLLGSVTVLTWLLQGTMQPLALLSLIPTLVLLLALGWSIALAAGFINVYIPDVQHGLEVGLQLLFYATPIMYGPEMLGNQTMSAVVAWNPLAAFVSLLRRPILVGQVPPLADYALAGALVAVLGALAVWTVAKLERKIIFHL